MAPTAELGGQPGLDDLFGQVHPDQPGAQGQHVGIVVLPAVDGRGVIVGHPGPHARHFVGHNAAADPGAVDHDAHARPCRRLTRAADGVRKIGIVHCLFAVGAGIDDFETQRGQVRFEDLLQLEAAVVRSNCDHFFGSCLCFNFLIFWRCRRQRCRLWRRQRCRSLSGQTHGLVDHSPYDFLDFLILSPGQRGPTFFVFIQ